jgi:hypothetical protein
MAICGPLTASDGFRTWREMAVALSGGQTPSIMGQLP